MSLIESMMFEQRSLKKNKNKKEDIARKINESFFVGWAKFDSLDDFKDAWFEYNNYNYKAWVIYKNDEGGWRLTTTYDYKHPDEEGSTYWQVDPKIIPEIKNDPDLSGIIVDNDLTEDTVKKSNGKWTNRGDDGEEHGTFKTKKQADAQRKAMYTQGYKGESLDEAHTATAWNNDNIDVDVINIDEKDYYDGHYYRVKVWTGSGYILNLYDVYANNEEEALEKVVAWAEDNDKSILIDVDEVYDDINGFYADEYQDGDYEDESDFAENYLDYVYVDATMEGASKPYYVRGENLQILDGGIDESLKRDNNLNESNKDNEKYPNLDNEVYDALANVVFIAKKQGYFVKKADIRDAVDYFLNRFYKSYAGSADTNENVQIGEFESIGRDEDETFNPDYDWEMDANRFDDIRSPYYNGDLEDDDFDEDSAYEIASRLAKGAIEDDPYEVFDTYGHFGSNPDEFNEVVTDLEDQLKGPKSRDTLLKRIK